MCKLVCIHSSARHASSAGLYKKEKKREKGGEERAKLP